MAETDLKQQTLTLVPVWKKICTLRKTPTVAMSLTTLSQSCIEYTSPWAGFKLTTLVVIGTDCIGSCKSNYHMITVKMLLDPLGNRTKAPHNEIIIESYYIFFNIDVDIKIP